MKDMIRIGIIGFGNWGSHLFRHFRDTTGVEVACICDIDPASLEKMKIHFPAIRSVTDPREVFSDRNLCAVAIATPASTHYELALEALRSGKHVLVEKPMADSLDKCYRLMEAASKSGRILMVDHIFPFHGAVCKLKEIIREGVLGDLFYVDSVRANLGIFQRDVNVIWDLAVHDVFILDYLIEEKPVSVSAIARSHVRGQPENIAYVTLMWGNDTLAHIHVNWLAPIKIRQAIFCGSKKMAVWNDLDPVEKVRIYDKGVSIGNGASSASSVIYRSGEVQAPALDSKDALLETVRHFIHCIVADQKPVTDAASALRVVRILEAASKSAGQNGSLVGLG